MPLIALLLQESVPKPITMYRYSGEYMSDNDKTVQKKLNLRESYAEALEDAAEELYGSNYKQARVVEALLDQTRFQPDSQRIAEDLRRNGLGIDPMAAANPHSKDDEEEEEEETLSIEEQLERMKELDVDNAAVTVRWLREQGPAKISRKALVDILQSRTEYGQASAYNIAGDALSELIESPMSRLDEWAEDKSEELAKHSRRRSRTFAAFAGVDESYVETDVWYTSEQKAAEVYQQLVVRVRLSDVARTRREAAFEELADRRPEFVEESFIERERKEL